MDIKQFVTRKQAENEIATMRGWDAKPVKIVGNDNDGNPAERWAIQCTQGKTVLYMRDDGYVR